MIDPVSLEHLSHSTLNRLETEATTKMNQTKDALAVTRFVPWIFGSLAVVSGIDAFTNERPIILVGTALYAAVGYAAHRLVVRESGEILEHEFNASSARRVMDHRSGINTDLNQ